MKSRIVCNTGPLIALSLIDCQHVLSQLYDPLIPRKVIEEWISPAIVNWAIQQAGE